MTAPGVQTSTSLLGGEPALRPGYGLGFHYATPVGPLQIDFGLRPRLGLDRWDSAYRIHLSLGTL